MKEYSGTAESAAAAGRLMGRNRKFAERKNAPLRKPNIC